MSTRTFLLPNCTIRCIWKFKFEMTEGPVKLTFQIQKAIRIFRVAFSLWCSDNSGFVSYHLHPGVSNPRIGSHHEFPKIFRGDVTVILTIMLHSYLGCLFARFWVLKIKGKEVNFYQLWVNSNLEKPEYFGYFSIRLLQITQILAFGKSTQDRLLFRITI